MVHATIDKRLWGYTYRLMQLKEHGDPFRQPLSSRSKIMEEALEAYCGRELSALWNRIEELSRQGHKREAIELRDTLRKFPSIPTPGPRNKRHGNRKPRAVVPKPDGCIASSEKWERPTDTRGGYTDNN